MTDDYAQKAYQMALAAETWQAQHDLRDDDRFAKLENDVGQVGKEVHDGFEKVHDRIAKYTDQSRDDIKEVERNLSAEIAKTNAWRLGAASGLIFLLLSIIGYFATSGVPWQ